MAVSKIENNRLFTETLQSGTFTLAAGESGYVDFDIQKSGYTPLGVVGYSTNSAGVLIQQCRVISSGAVRLTMKNTTSSEQSNKAIIVVLYQPN